MRITEHEMRGLLAGKCIPSDILVGESLAAYLARKFASLLQELASAHMASDTYLKAVKAAERRELGLKAQLDALAAENALIHSEPSLASMMEALDIYYADEDVPERAMLAAHRALLPKRMPATDTALNAVRAEGVIMFATKQLSAAGDLDSTITLERLMLDAEEFAGQLRAGKDGAL